MLCFKSATWLKLELRLRPWPQLFYPFPCREVPLGHWLILYWMGYRPLTCLISGSGPEHNSLFIVASKKVIWICRLLKVKLKPTAFHSNQFSKMYPPWVDGESSHRLSYIYIYLYIWGNYILVICCVLLAFNQTNRRWYKSCSYSDLELTHYSLLQNLIIN